MSIANPTAYRTSLLPALLLVMAVGAAVTLYFLKENEKNEKLHIRQELTDTVAAQKKLELDLQTAQLSVASLEEKVKSQEEIILNIKHSLDEQKELREKVESQILVKEAEIQGLRNQAFKAEEEKRDLQVRLEKQYEDYYDMKTQLGNILKTKEELEAKAKELAENGPISLGTVVVRQTPAV
jgi:chromosome segregation ATPase